MRDNILTPAPNSTQVPNIILDEWMPILKPTEFCVLMVIVRQTFGWIENIATGRRKEKDWISYSQLEEKTGKDTDALGKAIRKLRLEYELIEVYDKHGELITDEKLSNRSQLFFRVKTSNLNKTPKPKKSVSSPNRKNRFDQTDKPDMTKETLLQKKPLPNPPPREGTRPDDRATLTQDDTKKGNEQVSYSKLMAYSGKPFHPGDFSGLTDDELWAIGIKLHLHTRVVRAQYESIMHMCESGELAKYVAHLPKADTRLVVTKWLERRLQQKKLPLWADYEEHDMVNNSPAKRKEMDQMIEEYKKKIFGK